MQILLRIQLKKFLRFPTMQMHCLFIVHLVYGAGF